MGVQKFFSKEQEAQIIEAIKLAEKNTSGEIKVHVEGKAGGNAYQRAAEVFELLEMHQTELRNGILFYLATQDKAFTILGDKGIHEKVQDHFWEEIRDEMTSYFKTQDFTTGLVNGITQAGHALAEFFPYQKNDKNELSDDISTSDQ